MPKRKTADKGWVLDKTDNCGICGAPTITEHGRGWWCSNPACKLAKGQKDIRKRDKYRPVTGTSKCSPDLK